MKPSVQYLVECYSQEKLRDAPENLERSSESEEHALWNLHKSEVTCNILPVIENQEVNVRNGPLNFRLRQNIRELARELKNTADSLQIRPGSALLSVERAILVNEGLNRNEMQVVKDILSERTPTTISRIAEHLGKHITAGTFRATLRYLCYSAFSIPEELAVACELIKITYPMIKQLSEAASIHEVINEFIEDKLGHVLH